MDFWNASGTLFNFPIVTLVIFGAEFSQRLESHAFFLLGWHRSWGPCIIPAIAATFKEYGRI